MGILMTRGFRYILNNNSVFSNELGPSAYKLLNKQNDYSPVAQYYFLKHPICSSLKSTIKRGLKDSSLPYLLFHLTICPGPTAASLLSIAVSS